jgi:nucleoid-associated protein YgaU
MTRETRIGLLVGLAFIVTFGLVLSELTGSTEPVRAPRTAGVIESRNETWMPIIAQPLVQDVPAVAAVDTRLSGGSAEPAGGEAVVRSALVTPKPVAAGGTVETQLQMQPAPVVAAAANTANSIADAASSVINAATSSKEPAGPKYTVVAGDSLRKIARKQYGAENEKEYTKIFEANRGSMSDETSLKIGQELVIPALKPAAPKVAAAAPVAAPAVAAAAPQPKPGVAPVPAVAQPVQVAAIAGQPAPKEAKPAARSGVEELDARQLKDKFLMSSAAPATAIQPLPAEQKEATAATIAAAADGAGKPKAAPASEGKSGKVYVVKEKDTLAKIARLHLNSSSNEAVMKIYNANKDKLSSPTKLPVGAELRIPS